MNAHTVCIRIVAAIALIAAPSALGSLLTFDDFVGYPPTYSGDGDGDGILDVLFTTDHPNGFYGEGPGSSQYFVHEPGLASSTLLNPDVRVDFFFGAVEFISFGFAVNDMEAHASNYAHLELFDAGGTSLGAATVYPDIYVWDSGNSASIYIEAELNLYFSGTAAYGLFDFGSRGTDFIIDDFRGRFGSSEQDPVPEPSTAVLLVLGMVMAGARKRGC